MDPQRTTDLPPASYYGFNPGAGAPDAQGTAAPPWGTPPAPAPAPPSYAAHDAYGPPPGHYGAAPANPGTLSGAGLQDPMAPQRAGRLGTSAAVSKISAPAKQMIMGALRDYEVTWVIEGSRRIKAADRGTLKHFVQPIADLSLRADSELDVLLATGDRIVPRKVRSPQEATDLIDSFQARGEVNIGAGVRHAVNSYWNSGAHANKGLLVLSVQLNAMDDVAEFKDAVNNAIDQITTYNVGDPLMQCRFGILPLDPTDASALKQARKLDDAGESKLSRFGFKAKRSLTVGQLTEAVAYFDCVPEDRVWLLLAGCVVSGFDVASETSAGEAIGRLEMEATRRRDPRA